MKLHSRSIATGIIISLMVATLVASCSRGHDALDSALRAAVDNRPELEAVLDHYKDIYYLWVGIGEDSFSTYYNSDDPGVNAYNFLYDFNHDRWTGYTCEAAGVGFYSALNNGLYEPYNTGWDF